jgi:OmpA family protein/glucodextranase-like protein
MSSRHLEQGHAVAGRSRDSVAGRLARGVVAMAIALALTSTTLGVAQAAGVTVSPTAGLHTTEAGGTAQFTVVLQTQPTNDVTIGVSTSDATEGTVSTSSLTFTAADWDAPQTVTITGVDDAIDDGDVAYSIVTAAAASLDASYDGIDPDDVSVTNTDDEGPGITVTPVSGLVTTEAGGTAQFTVVLKSQPTSSVTVAISSSDPTEGTPGSPSLNFTGGNWNNPRTVTVTGVDDPVVDGTVGYTIVTAAAVSADPDYAGLNPADVSVSNTDNDAAAITVSPTSGLTTSEAGGTAQFTLVLTSQPIFNVTVGLSSSDATEGTVAPASVTFTPANWNVAQAATVSGVDDPIVDGAVGYTIHTAAATSADLSYGGVDPADVSVSNSDNDAVGITVNPTSGLVTTEAGGAAQFTVVLTSLPTANVSVGLSSSDVTEGTVAPATVTFTSGNWNVAQTVTVTGVDDLIDDGNVAYTVVTAAATSADGAYGGLNPADVSVGNTDNDAVAITVNPTSGLVTTEAGGTAQFTVVLGSQPTANVSVGLSSSDVTEGTVAPASVTFTTANWSVAQMVTVTGVNDLIDDGNVPYTIVTGPATSTDGVYGGLNPPDVSVSNTDNDAAGITVNPIAGLVTTEAGGTAQFTVVLASQPTANVGIGLSSSDNTEGLVAPASLTFTSGNWNVAQTVTVTGVDDFLDDGNIAYSVLTGLSTSADASYNGLNPANVSLSNTDNDAAGITVNPTAGLVTTETAGTAQFTVALTSQPTANVAIGLSSSDLTEGTVAPASLTFTAANWSVAQTVTVTGVDDLTVDGSVAYTVVTAPATSPDPGYNGLNAANVAVTNNDNDVAGVTITPTAGLVTSEAGGTAQFTARLNTQPSAGVSIAISSSDPTEGTVAPLLLTFTAANWNVAQTVTVTGVDDPAADGSVAYTIVTAPIVSLDLNYNLLDPANVAVSNSDNDAAGITVSPTAGLVTTEAGGTAQFTVVLNTLPAANVVVGLSSSDVTEGTVAPSSLTFTVADWNVAQTVTVTGVGDALDDGNIAYTIQTAPAASADPSYNGLNPANVAVTNTDDDVSGITVTPVAGLVTTEAAGTAQFTVVLTSQPAANVGIGLSSSDVTEGTVAPASLTFTLGNWNNPQTVTLTGVDDLVVDGPVAYTVVTAPATSADVGYNALNAADVAVTNADNDAAGFTVNPTAGLVTTEAGGTAQFTVTLTSQPAANVSAALSSSDLTEGAVAPASLTFTAANWNVAQTVTVTGIDDFLDDGNVAYSILTAPAVSTDLNYNGVNPVNVAVSNSDDDAAGVTVDPVAGLVTSEAGAVAQFTAVLRSQPTANVGIGLSSSDLTEGTVAPASLTFTPANWNVPQTVSVTGVDDPAVDGAVPYTILTAAATSTDAGYNGLNPANVGVSNTDNDVAAIAVVPLAGLVTTEAAGTARFTAVLTSQPTANVGFGLSSSDVTEGTVAPASLTFTAANWNVPQSVTVTGVDDFLDEGDIAYTIVSAAAASADLNYNGLDPLDVEVVNRDDDSGPAVALELIPERERVGAGQPVRYTLAIRNLSPLALTRLEIRHELPPRFGYLAGSAARDGRGIGDPTGTRLQMFPLDTLAGFIDQNGDGVPGPGERGYVALSWTLASGASATPGAYSNAAVAVSLDGCGGCQVSNRAEASVRVEEDAVFARGTVLGRVFEDADRDGRQGLAESGVSGAVIALDDGTQVTTDTEGRFHLPDLDAGPRALKLDLARLGMPATPTNDVTQVVNVSPGLLATVRFGVWIARDTVRTGQPMGEGLAIVTDPMEHAVHVAGNAIRGSAVVNGRAVAVRSVDARLDSPGSGQILRLTGGRIDSTRSFVTDVGDSSGVLRWWLEIRDGRRAPVRTLEGEGIPPARVRWNGRLDEERRLRGGEVYAYQFRVAYADGVVVEGPRRAVGVEGGSSVAMTLPGDAFQPGKAVLSLSAGQALASLGRMVLRAPREVVVIEGHTDSIGTAEANRRLSVRRAEAVAEYLSQRQGVLRGRLVVEGHGEARPVAGNDTEDGRELNRRVEIYGMTSEVKRTRLYGVFRGAAIARVGDLEVPVDPAGRFACRVPTAGHDTIHVVMTNRLGRTAVARLRMPALEILEPRGEMLMPFGKSADGVRVEPRSALRRRPEPLAGLSSAGSGRPVAYVRLRGHTDAGNRVEVDGETVPVEADGAFVAELSLRVGENAFGIVVRDSAGTQREANLVVRALDQEADREAIAAIARDPELTVLLPPRGTVLGARELTVSGHTDPASRVTANRDTLPVAADGRFVGRVTLPEGRSVLTIVVEDALGHRKVIEREIEVRSRRLFLVGLADGVVGRAQSGAFVGAGDGTRTWTEGRIAYQLRGWISGKYLISSAFDSRRRDFGTLFRDLDDAGRDRLLVNLDPDRLYPVFGDSSVVTHGGPAGGRFFLAVEGDGLRASVGDFPIALDEVELASFHRTLYGGQLRLATGGGTDVTRTTSVALFGAQARNVHVRDAIRATGGTLYYLSHGEAIEGSVQVSLVVHDRDTGLPLQRVALQRGLDYTAKELEGRLLFTRPVASAWDDGSLVDGDRLIGHPVTIEVDYETRGTVGEKSAVGARVKQGLGPLTLGATAVDDRAGAGRYQLMGGDLALRMGPQSRVGLELAESEGQAGRRYASDDGGLAFTPADTAGVRTGRAWKLAAELAAGEWRPRLARLKLGGYVRRIESGFVAEDRPGGEALDQSGVRVGFDAGRLGQLSARLDQGVRGKTDSTAGRTHEVLGVLWRRDGVRAGVATEFEQRTAGGDGAADSSAGSIAGRLWWRPAERLRATVERLQTVSGAANDRTALGLAWQALSKLTLGARGTAGTAGRTMHGDLTLALGRRSAYLREEHRDEFGRRSSGTVFGVQAPLGATGRTYTEYQWQRDDAGDRALSVLGLEQAWRTADGLAWRVAGEHGARAGATGASTGRRTTVSSDLSYRGRLPVSGSTRGEVRMDGGATRQRQYLVSSRLEWVPAAGFVVRGDYRLSLARQIDLGITPVRFEESSVGLAYRPARSDRIQALARVTRLADRRPRSPGDSLSSETGLDVAALEASVRLSRDLEWSGKGAARVMRDGAAGLPSVATHGALWVNRLDYTFRRPVRFGVEYRRLTQRETGDQRGGWLQELSVDPSRNLRFGVGYNFTRFSGDVLDRGEESTKGWFVRGQSRY